MCDCLVALPSHSSTGHTLFAKNSDRPPTEQQIIRWNPPRRDVGSLTTTHINVAPARGETLASVLSMPKWCWGAEHGVNEAGVAMGNETIYTTNDPRTAPPALIGMDLVRLALERAASAVEAVRVVSEMIDTYGQGGSGHDTSNGERARPYWSSFLIADPADAWVVETSGNVVEAMQVTRTWAISNRTTIPAFDAAHRHPKQPVHLLVDPRLSASRELLATDSVSTELLQQHLQSHVGGDDGWTVCMHATDVGELVEATTASMIVELCEDPHLWWAQGSPCSTPYETARFSEMSRLIAAI